jgi:hypothetical protein
MKRRRKQALLITLVVSFLAAGNLVAISVASDYGRRYDDRRALQRLEVRSLDGGGNNRQNPTWGLAGTQYSRVAPANYPDGRDQPVGGPNPRYVSNRVFSDLNQNLFSETE